MPLRVTPLVQGEYYHIYNRGVAHQPIFNDKRDYERFLLCLDYYRHANISLRLSKLLQLASEERAALLKELKSKNELVVNLMAFCLMPNHFHLLVKQNTQDGVSRYMRLAINSYARYFNTKYQRVGSLFQGMFKVVRVETDEQLIHLSRYIHLNPLVSYIVKENNFLSYPWSSLSFYLHDTSSSIVDPAPVVGQFSSRDEYLKFVMDQVDYGKKLEVIKHLSLG